MPMIETINLTKKYGELIALNNLNLTIEEGACFGFIGPNGAGKTTTIKILATLLKPTWGEARINGKVIGYQNPQIRPLIGYVPDFMGAYGRWESELVACVLAQDLHPGQAQRSDLGDDLGGYVAPGYQVHLAFDFIQQVDSADLTAHHVQYPLQRSFHDGFQVKRGAGHRCHVVQR